MFNRYASSPTRPASRIRATGRACWFSACRYAIPASGHGTSWNGWTTRNASLSGQEIKYSTFPRMNNYTLLLQQSSSDDEPYTMTDFSTRTLRVIFKIQDECNGEGREMSDASKCCQSS